MTGINKNFIVQNGLEVGGVKIFAANSDIVTSGNVTSTSSASVTQVAVAKYVMQLPTSLASPTWYLLGTFSVNSGSGLGEALEIIVVGGSGYTASDNGVKDFIQIRFENGSSTNLEANYYSQGYREGITGVKCVSANGIGTGTSWNIYVRIAADLGRNFVEVRTTTDAKFTWIQTVSTDPGAAAANLVVASNKLVTATSNVVVLSGNLYVGGNIFQAGQQVSTSVGNGLSTVVINGNGTSGPFNLGSTPADSDQIQVWWNGIYQPKSTYNLSGTNLTFTEPIPSGSNVEVKILAGTGAQQLGTLADVNFTPSPTDGQFLSYNAATGKWIPATSAAQASVTRTAITYAVVFGGF